MSVARRNMFVHPGVFQLCFQPSIDTILGWGELPGTARIVFYFWTEHKEFQDEEMTQSFSSGSTIFGDTLDDTHQFTGSLFITGSTYPLTIDQGGGEKGGRNHRGFAGGVGGVFGQHGAGEFKNLSKIDKKNKNKRNKKKINFKP